MELIKIHEELINEAKGPLQAFEYILKAAGKSMGEANGALLKSVQKINPNVKQLFKATPEEVNKAFGRLEFKEYRKILVDFYLTNQKKEIEKILKRFDLSNTESVKLAKAEVANKLQHKNAIANDIVDRYKPKKVGTTGGKVSTPTKNVITDLSTIYSKYENELSELDDYLWKRVNRNNSLRQIFAINRISRSNWSGFRNELLNNLNSKLSASLNKKMDLKLNEVKPFLEGLDVNVQNQANSKKIIEESVSKFKEILNEQSKQLGVYSSFFNKLTPSSVTSLRNYLKKPNKDTWKEFTEDYKGQFKLTLTLMSFGTLGELLAGDLNSWEEIKNELDLKYATIPIPGLNVWFWGLNALYRWGKVIIKSFSKKEVEPGTEPFMDNQTGNTDDLEGIKN